MKRKIKRLFQYAKQLVFMVFFKFLGYGVRKFNSKYQNLWLISERGNDARDNGYWLYRYIKQEHPEINAEYVISEDSADYKNVMCLGGIVYYRSFKHYLAYYCADFLIGTHIQPASPDLMLFYHLKKFGIGARGKHIFLQHGITQSEMKWMHYPDFKVDLFVCGAKPEFEYIKNTFNHPCKVVKYLGLARFDNLIKSADKKREILIMPTWRGAEYPCDDNFQKTHYFMSFQSLINSREFVNLLEMHDYKLIFYPHVEMQKDIKYFSACSDRVVIATRESHDVQKLIMDCAVLITDYSSVHFDAAYIHKPVIYYQFDQDEYYESHYQKGFFDFKSMGFGPLCMTEKETVCAVKEFVEKDFEISEFIRQRITDFFPIRDSMNCQRIFDAIREMR